MNQSKKILAAMLTIPATVIVAGQVQAEEVTSIFEIKNDFVGTSDYTSSTSSKPIEAKTKGELREKILLQMENFTKGFTVTYTGPDVVTYKKDIEDIFEGLKADLNTTTTIDTASIDYTMLYGTFNNVRVKATETKSGNSVTEVKLEFSFNYLSDSIKSKVLDGMAADLTGNTNKSILTNAKTTVQKVKAIHDYVINSSYILPSNHSVASLVLEKGGSSHAYALWTYKLLKAAGINVRYVSGMSGGELHSWNLVEVGNQWYHLDIADNDNLLNGSKDIKYRYFLANNATIGGREIYFGADGITNGKWGIAYRAFENIVNPAQANNAMYYADGASNGKIYKLDLKDENVTVTEPPNISEETSGFGKILHYKLTSADTTEIEYLYFINDAVGKYLYQYNINSRKLQLVVKEPIKSISISGDKLTYSPISGTSKWILLNQFENFNQLEADKVNKAIDELTGLDKNKVMTARQLYNALTPEQQTLVTSFYKLEEIEKKLANSDSIVEKVIEQINNLNKLNNNYIIDVGNAKLAFEDSLTTEQQLLVYNKSILFAALDEVNKVKQLNNEISKIVVDVDEPFKTIPEFIKNIESVLTKYEDLLPSLKEAIEPPQKAFMEEYSATAIQLRNELQNFINKVNIINIKSEDYLTLMRTIQDEYENKLLISQIYLLTPAQKTKVESNIKEAEKLNKQISDFNTYMATVTSGDVANIVLTTEIVADMKAADALYKSMKPAQIKAIDLAVVKKLEAIMQRIEDLVNDKDVIAVKTAIEGLNYNNYRSFDELKNAVTSADSAFIDLKDKQALLPAGIKDKLEEYKEAVKVIGAIQDRINDLNELSPRETILNVRGDLNKLNSNHKKFVDEANLIVQEKRIQDTEIAARIQQVIDAINGLSNESTYAQVKSVYDQYIALGDAKSQVTNANELITLWEKVSNDADAIIHVNNLIKALNEKSKRDQIEAAQAAYDALPESSQKQVEGYEKIAELLAKLDEMETEVADQEAARLVEEKINALNDESTPAAIKAVRDAYEALNDNAKKLVSKKMYDLLVFYENSMKEQEEQAKKEAQVIIDRINRITNSYTEAQIKDVRLAYNKLSELAKSYVTNIQKLIDAEAYILYQNTVVKEAKLQAAAFDAYMANINKNSSTAEIAKARAYYNSLSYEAKRHVKTYEKLRRLETMWNDPDYLGLIFTYYPDYIHAIKPGGIEIEKPVYDPLYIPDDSDDSSYLPPTATWTPFEAMSYDNGRYTATITSSQMTNVADRTMMLTAGDIEILIPTADMKGTSAAIGVAMTTNNNRLDISFTEGYAVKSFSSVVEIRVPMRLLGGNASMAVQRVTYNGNTSASYKIEGSNYVIRTKTGGVFTAGTSNTSYTDLAGSNSITTGIREFATRGITYPTAGKAVIPNDSATRADVATLLANALDISSTQHTNYKDLGNTVSTSQAQGLLEAGIMSGVTTQQFEPNMTVTRQEAAIIIANMYRYLNQDLALAYNELNTKFTDISQLSYEARQSIAILELFGVVNGTTSSKFNPQQPLTRAQFAEMLYSALTAIEYL